MSPFLFCYLVIIKFALSEIINATHENNKICNGTSDCIINCGSNYTHGYCQNDIIQCPLNTYNCTINCYGNNACVYSYILCPSNANCNINCGTQYSCVYTDIICPLNGKCDVKCGDGINSCFKSNIIWPTTSEIYSSLECGNGEKVCYGLNFPIPDPDKSLIINCDDIFKCGHTKIICPANSDCLINCNAETACASAIIIWPTETGIYGTLSCNGMAACTYITFPIPNPDIPLTITCSTNNVCQFSIIICPENSDCTIECTADYSCLRTKIIWPTSITATSTLICSGNNACQGTTPQNPIIIDAPNTENYNLICSSTEQCVGYQINCPQDYGCFIECSAESACSNMIINWIETQSYNIICNPLYDFSCYGVSSIKSSNLDCGGDYTCFKSIVYCPINADCTIQCDGSLYSCAHITVYGPINHQLTMNCGESEGTCWKATIYAQNTSQFTLNSCLGIQGSCSDITIYLPPNNNGIKRAVIDGANNELEGHLNFYAINGWLDVDIINYSGTRYGRSGIFYCGIGYIWSCPLSRFQWEGGCGICDELYNGNTLSPTQNPSYPTVIPTGNPTKIPTINPTIYPTTTPLTNIPSSNHSNATLAIIPTVYPTIAPSNDIIMKYGVIITLTFNYTINQTNLTEIRNIFIVYTQLILSNTINDVDVNGCISSNNYNISILYINYTSAKISTIIFVCNNSEFAEQLIINNIINKNKLEQDLIDIINEDNITLIVIDNIHIEMDMIEIIDSDSKEITDTHIPSIHPVKESNPSNSSSEMITIISVLIICIFILCLIIYIIYKKYFNTKLNIAVTKEIESVDNIDNELNVDSKFDHNDNIIDDDIEDMFNQHIDLKDTKTTATAKDIFIKEHDNIDDDIEDMFNQQIGLKNTTTTIAKDKFITEDDEQSDDDLIINQPTTNSPKHGEMDHVVVNDNNYNNNHGHIIDTNKMNKTNVNYNYGHV